jgi:hypothetical protein
LIRHIARTDELIEKQRDQSSKLNDNGRATAEALLKTFTTTKGLYERQRAKVLEDLRR